ncbi:DNA polymerase III gamma/tau subunit [Paenibacillus endophyticus]|uniref:DNA polymerase III gamma/tau subunit n=1 Tax=Paenibacillus endophyticus TaxID=1294268 RepID=A0A7W5C4Z8_9BACL|nr:DUF4358 domain-containing protein [Paenibacillus endophyticus]MBB3151307.1 DNA polymerase III gamma/tau subunit [Paenibacillus endophyticus]
MFRFNAKYITIALLAAATALLAASCSSTSQKPIDTESSTHISSGTTENTSPADTAVATEEPSSTPQPSPSEQPLASPAATPAPTATAEAATPAETNAPAKESEGKITPKPTKKPEPTEKATVNPKPQQTLKPTATAPVAKPSAKPTATAPVTKPSSKPTATSPVTKPSDRPTSSATAKPSPLPIATPSPTPKPTAKPDPDNANAEVTVADIAAKLKADSGLGPLTAVEGEKIKDTYGIDPDKQLVDGSFNQAMMMIQAGEFSVVQLKSDADYDSVKAGFEARAQMLQTAFESYLQDQYEQAKNYQIIRNGNFVLFSITPDQKKTAELFHEFFKK